jgi:hypothetical protein
MWSRDAGLSGAMTVFLGQSAATVLLGHDGVNAWSRMLNAAMAMCAAHTFRRPPPVHVFDLSGLTAGLGAFGHRS